jgi:hypothetical protein
LLGDASLLCGLADILLTKCRAELSRFDRLVLPGAKPGFHGIVAPCVLKFFKTTKPADKAAIGWWGTGTVARRGDRLGCPARC